MKFKPAELVNTRKDEFTSEKDVHVRLRLQQVEGSCFCPMRIDVCRKDDDDDEEIYNFNIDVMLFLSLLTAS